MTKFFDAKAFNEQAFGKYMQAVPDVKKNKLLESGAVVGDNRLISLFADQTGSYFGTIPFFGNLDQTDPDNYDGVSDLTADTTTTYTQGVFVRGRAKGWTEKSFSKEITAGVDFMANIRSKIKKYWNNVDQDEILAILKALFNLSDAKGKEFAASHTYDVTTIGDGTIDGTTVNSATQKACGDNRGAFGLIFAHSTVTKNMENKNLLENLKYTDPNGVSRDLRLFEWNGKLVVEDDSMPAEEAAAKYVRCDKSFVGAKLVKDSGASGDSEINKADVTKDISDIAAGEYVYLLPKHTAYTTYVLGDGVITMQPVACDHPYEMVRDAKTNGGIDTLFTRKRDAFAVFGFSWTNKSVKTLSPTKEEMGNPANWEIINNGQSSKKYFDIKAIPMVRIVSRG